MTKTIAVTGARGLLGSTLLASIPGSSAVTSDVRDAGSLSEEIKQLSPFWIVHTAAKTNVAECEKNPDEAYAINAGGTEHVVAAARSVGARLIYISTVSVFKGDTGNYKENDTPEPMNVYNTTKYQGECAVDTYEKGMTLRLNLIGIHPNGSRGKNFIEWLVDSFHENKDMTLFTDAMVNPLSNWTVAHHIKKIMEDDIKERILHIAAGNVMSKAEIGELVQHNFPKYKGIVTRGSIENITDSVFRPKQMWLNVDKARSLGFSSPSIQDELALIAKKNGFVSRS